MTPETMFAQSPYSFKWEIGCTVPKKISPLARKVLEVPTSLEINFSTNEEGLHCSFHPED